MRIIIGIILIYLAVLNPLVISSWVSMLLGVFGAAMIIEGVLAY
jgi:hypothetical protein